MSIRRVLQESLPGCAMLQSDLFKRFYRAIDSKPLVDAMPSWQREERAVAVVYGGLGVL